MRQKDNPFAIWEKVTLFWLLLSALLPIYGSWLNLNFAALQPDHLHLYGEEVDLDHHQEDELLAHKGHSHDHHHHESKPPDDKTAVPSTVTYLPNLNSLLLILTAVFLTLFAPPLLLHLRQRARRWRDACQSIALIAQPLPLDPPRP